MNNHLGGPNAQVQPGYAPRAPDKFDNNSSSSKPEHYMMGLSSPQEFSPFGGLALLGNVMPPLHKTNSNMTVPNYTGMKVQGHNLSAPSSATMEHASNSNGMTFGASLDNDSAMSAKLGQMSPNRPPQVKLIFENRTFMLGKPVTSFKQLLEQINGKFKLNLEDSGSRLFYRTNAGLDEYSLLYTDDLTGEIITVMDDDDLAIILQNTQDLHRPSVRLVLNSNKARPLHEGTQSLSGDRIGTSPNGQTIKPAAQYVEVSALRAMVGQLAENFQKQSPEEFTAKIGTSHMPCFECSGVGFTYIAVSGMQNSVKSQTITQKPCEHCGSTGVRPIDKSSLFLLKLMDWKIREQFLEPLQVFLSRLGELEDESQSASSSLKNIQQGRFGRVNQPLPGMPEQVSMSNSSAYARVPEAALKTSGPVSRVNSQGAGFDANLLAANRNFQDNPNLVFHVHSMGMVNQPISSKDLNREGVVDNSQSRDDQEYRATKKQGSRNLDSDETLQNQNNRGWSPLNTTAQKIGIGMNPFGYIQERNYRLNQSASIGLVNNVGGPVRDDSPTMDIGTTMLMGMQSMPISPDPYTHGSEFGSVYSGAPSTIGNLHGAGLPEGGVITTENGPRAIANQSTYGSVFSGRKLSGMGLQDAEDQGPLNMTLNSIANNPNDVSVNSNPNNWVNKRNLSLNQDSTLNGGNSFLGNSMAMPTGGLGGGRRNSQMSQDNITLQNHGPRQNPSMNISMQTRVLKTGGADLNRTSPSTQPKESTTSRLEMSFEILKDPKLLGSSEEDALPRCVVDKTNTHAMFQVSNSSQTLWKKGMIFLLKLDKTHKEEFALPEDVKVGEHTEIRFDLSKQLQEIEPVGESEHPSPEVSQTKRQKASLEIFWKNLDDGVHYFSTKPAVMIEYSR